VRPGAERPEPEPRKGTPHERVTKTHSPATAPHAGLIGNKADGWVAPLGTAYDTKPAGQDRIDAAAHAVGRKPTDIRRVIQPVGAVTNNVQTRERPRTGPGVQPIRTTPEVWARIIAEFVYEGRFDTINFVPEHESIEQLTRFATEVIPAARAAIAAYPKHG
jgi:hypothetical protein